MKKTKEYLKYKFTKEETEQQSPELARQIQALQRLEDQKKEVSANLKAQIEAAGGLARDLSQKITNGYEYRDIECSVEMNMPARGRKSIFRNDTHEFVREMPMDAKEMQGELPLADEAADAAADAQGAPEKTSGRGPKVTYRTAVISANASGAAAAGAGSANA